MTAAGRRTAGLALALLAWLACTAGLRPLMLPDEGRYAGVAWEMLHGGHWAVPTLDGLPYFHKPPLFYWIGAASMRVFGASEFAARVPSLAGALAAALGLYLFVRRWGDEAGARRALLLLATQPFFFVGAQFANLDMLVAGCIAAATLLGAHALLLREQGLGHRAPLVGAYAAAACGLLAKGLIGPVLPAAVLLAWVCACRRPKAALGLVSLPGLLVFAAIGLPWFLLMQRQYAGFFDYFFIYHQFQRYAQGGFNNEHGVWFFPVVLMLLTLPSSLLVFRARPRQAPSRAPLSLALLMGCWLAVIVVFFSIPRSKLVGYVLPALPPWAWLLSSGLAGLGAGWRRVLLVCGAALSFVAVGVAATEGTRSTRDIGLALQSRWRAGEPVVLLDRYAFDLPFYARIDADPIVVSRWDGALRDDWRKELVDAGRFEPARAAQRQISAAALRELACGTKAWLVGSAADLRALHVDDAADEAVRGAQVSLWQSDPARCRPQR